MKYYVLGANGFIGSNISKVLKQSNFDVIELNRKKFDITNQSDYKKYDFSDSIIIDSIASIDSEKSELFRINVDGLKNFINYLNLICKNFTYIYISTTSTQILSQVENNHYIKSKFLAEEHIKHYVKNYKIIRLIFPFGKGENSNRLISRLISKIKYNEQFSLDSVTLNLTPIELLNEHVIELLENNNREINFTDGNVYRLKDIVDFIYKELKIETNYIFNQNKKNYLNLNDYSLLSEVTTIENFIKRML